MKVSVTGATGFLGGHLVERLIADGHSVAILARDAARAARFEGRVARLVVGDIADRTRIDELVSGAEAVIHLVSNFRTASGPPETYRRINLEGSRVVFEASERAGVRRYVHCSTIGVHGHVRSTPATETSPYNPGDLYQETKVAAERYLQGKLATTKVELVVVRPCSLYGPGDTRMLKMFRMLTKGRFLMVGPCAENYHPAYIDDVIDGFVLALNAPVAGETFIVGGSEYLPLRDFVAAAAESVGARPPWLRVPYAPVYAAAVLCEAVCVPLGIEPPLHRRRVRFYRNNRAFSIDKARRMLGYSPKVDLREGLRRTVAWYRDNGLL
ncbi:MAG: NAD-dependent epimerase/dehydratase family protein [Burkholderiaceae bacterium]|nr:NAD-dependent epimerase/dehydratase family protein [Burkholderiaceae bacterium]